MTSRRVLITGLSTYWGGRLAQALERNDEIEAIIGVDNHDPTLELERTEFVRVGTQHGLLRRIVEAAEIDTVIDSRLVPDSTVTSSRKAHENNVIGTMNILAACGGEGSSVRKFVFKSSTHYYGSEQDDPGFFTEAMGRPHPPRTPIERDIVEAEATVADFAEKTPEVAVSILRCANVLGPDVETSHTRLFSLPVVPMILGFDPRYQFVHEDDVVAALEHVVESELRGIFNVAGDGVLAFTEVVGLLGKTYAPVLPPWGTGLAAAALKRTGIRIPAEMLQLLRFGRGVDNRKLKATGFQYRYTTREAVMKLAEHMRLHPVLRGVQEPYRYEREVEDFLRWSPHVRNPTYRKEGRLSPGEAVELQKTLASYGERVGAPGRGSRQVQSQAAMRAAEAGEGSLDAGEADRDVADGRGGKAAPRRAGSNGAPEPGATGEPGASGQPGAPEDPRAPVEHYDDLEADEIVGLVDSLEGPDLGALLDYERAHEARPRVISAIEGVLARRRTGQRG
jgi:UDP-glucose 4-epimerase